MHIRLASVLDAGASLICIWSTCIYLKTAKVLIRMRKLTAYVLLCVFFLFPRATTTDFVSLFAHNVHVLISWVSTRSDHGADCSLKQPAYYMYEELTERSGPEVMKLFFYAQLSWAWNFLC